MAVVQNAIGEWWIHPIATALRTQQRTVFGAIADDGAILACQIDHDSGSTLRIPVATAPVDDHNVPSLWAAPGRRMVVMWTHHSQERFIHAKVSDVAGDLASLPAAVDQVSPEQASTCSYTQIHHLPHASSPEVDAFVVFSRVQAASWSLIPFTVDQATGALAWGATVQLMVSSGQSYFSTADARVEGGHVLRVAWGYNPAQPTHAIRYVEIDTITGAVTSPVDETVTANIYAGTGLPLIDTAVAPLVPEPGAGYSRRLFYVRPGPATAAVAFADWSESDPDTAEYKVISRQGDGTWTTRSYGTAGPRIGYVASANYIPGMAFPNPCNDDVVYLARSTATGGSVERATASEGGSWTTQTLVASEDVWARPTPPVDGDDTLLAFRIIRYGATGFRDYLADVHYFTQPQTPPVITTVDRGLSVWAGELRSGRMVSPVRFSAGSWAVEHRAAGSIRLTVPFADAALAATAADLIPAMEPARCYLAVIADGRVLQAGPIWSRDWDFTTRDLTLVASGIEALFDHRFIMASLAPTASNPNPWRGWETTYTGTRANIARRLLQLAMSHTGGSIPMILPPSRTGSESRTYYGYALRNLGQEIRDLTTGRGVPEVVFRPEVTQDQLSITWRMIVGDPMVKQDGDEWRWDTDASRGQVRGGGIRQDSSKLTTSAWATNDWQQKSRLMRNDVNEALIDGGFPVLEAASNHDTVQIGDTLLPHAAGLLRTGARPRTAVQVSVSAEQEPRLGEYREGDYARIYAESDPFIRAVFPHPQFRGRIVRIGGNLARPDLVDVDLQPGWETAMEDA